MQTFLPYGDFARSAAVLDWRRLGKQRSENLQIMMALLGYVKDDEQGCFVPGEQPAWIVKHWVTNMWRGHEWILWKYHQAICHEWADVRGYEDTTLHKMDILTEGEVMNTNWPSWMNDPGFHTAMQSVLIQKQPEHYRPLFGPDVPEDLEYVRGKGIFYVEW